MTGTDIKITSTRRTAAVARPVRSARFSDSSPLVVTDDVLFRWARIVQIAKLFPIMHTIRALEFKIQSNTCRTCHNKKTQVPLDRSPLADARRLLAECSDELARLVKESAGILRYQVSYHDRAGTLHIIVR